jgi:hypothetical protein
MYDPMYLPLPSPGGAAFERCAVSTIPDVVPNILLSMGGYRLAKGWVENMDHGAFRNKKMLDMEDLTEMPLHRVLPASVDPRNLLNLFLSLLLLRPFAGLRTVVASRPASLCDSRPIWLVGLSESGTGSYT